jgi:hypothetical protein
VRRVGYVFASNGVLLLISYVLLGVGLNTTTSRIAATKPTLLSQNKLILDFARVVINDIRGVLVMFVVIYIGIGLICYIAAHVLKKRQKPIVEPIPVTTR